VLIRTVGPTDLTGVLTKLKGRDVQTVMIGGRIVMRDRKLLTVDEGKVLEKAREYEKSVKTSLGMQ
jgi:cytosine/adenosine deaminase-related metal-dependent hydrolase